MSPDVAVLVVYSIPLLAFYYFSKQMSINHRDKLEKNMQT